MSTLPKTKSGNSVLLPALADRQAEDLFRVAILSLPLAIKLFNAPALAWALPVTALLLYFWERLFSRRRKQNAGFSWMFYAAVFCLLLPIETTLWQLVLAVSFGAVMGEQIYGGRGMSFTHPVTLGLAFLFYSFDIATTAQTIDLTILSYLVLLAGIPFVLYYRLIDWLCLLAILFAYLVLVLVTNTPIPIPSVSAIVCVLYCACDNASPQYDNSSHRKGNSRVLYGLLAGGLIYLFDPSATDLEKVVFAVLIANISTPLLSWVANSLLHYPAVKSSQDSYV